MQYIYIALQLFGFIFSILIIYLMIHFSNRRSRVQIRNDINSQIYDFKIQILEQLKKEYNDVQIKLEKVDEKLNYSLEEHKAQMNKELTEANQKLFEITNNVRTQINDSIVSFSESTREVIENLKTTYTDLQNEFAYRFESVNSEIYKFSFGIKDDLRRIKSDIRNTRNLVDHYSSGHLSDYTPLDDNITKSSVLNKKVDDI